MNDSDFHHLLNSYLDKELSAEELERFRQALRESPRYRVIFRQSLILQKAQKAMAYRKPAWAFLTGCFRNFCSHCGSMMVNATVFVFALGIYQGQDTQDIDARLPLPETPTLVETQNAVTSRETKELRASAIATSIENEMDVGPVDTDFYNPFPDEEYGFVRL